MNCLSEEQIVRLLDDGVALNQSDSLKAHIGSCAQCGRTFREFTEIANHLSVPEDFDADTHVAGIMGKLGESRPVSLPLASTKTIGARAFVRVALVSAAIAASFFGYVSFRGNLPPRDLEGTFSPRGGTASVSLKRNVGVHVVTGTTNFAHIKPGSVIGPDARIAASYRNTFPRPVYLMLFAVDSSGATHWVYPAYIDANTNPSAVRLAESTDEKLMPTSVTFEAPSPGPMRIVTLLSERELHVQDIESRSQKAADLPSLARDFGEGVSEIVVTLEK